ncbi:MAG TPA: DUF4365 domain-containing protein [Kofleriaceae bacterium]|nr:DUF4365 domain-containing protein [Kofleriaceae bacterium]
MAEIGHTDVFERKYKELFRSKLADHGEFVAYERDRGVRDIGVHFTHRLASGGEDLTTALCWFQLKGIMASTLAADALKDHGHVSLRLKVRHLQYWYMQPVATYLALYVESIHTFLVLNLKTYVEDRWGLKIFKLKKKSETVAVPLHSVLDDQALRLILMDTDSKAWAQALGASTEEARHCRRDFTLIWRIGTAEVRAVEHRVEIVDWQSKTRGEIRFEERTAPNADWSSIRLHWQLGLQGEDIEATYPYLEFFPFGDPPPESSSADSATDNDEQANEDDEDYDSDSWEYDDDEWDAPPLKLSNGTRVRGKDAANEYYWYELGVHLNALGRDLFAYVKTLVDVGIVAIDENVGEFISVAPWHNRSV